MVVSFENYLIFHYTFDTDDLVIMSITDAFTIYLKLIETKNVKKSNLITEVSTITRLFVLQRLFLITHQYWGIPLACLLVRL